MIRNIQILSLRFLRIWSHLRTKSLMKNFIFCAVYLLFVIHLWRPHHHDQRNLLRVQLNNRAFAVMLPRSKNKNTQTNKKRECKFSDENLYKIVMYKKDFV